MKTRIVMFLLIAILFSVAVMDLIKVCGVQNPLIVWLLCFLFAFAIVYSIVSMLRAWDENKICNTCGKSLWLPMGADHLWCALRRHPFWSLLGWILVGFWQALRICGCPAARWFRKMEALLRKSIRKEAFRKGLRPGGKRS